jgi:tape measure domain-containing protein
MADATRRVSVRLSLDDAARVKAGLREVGESGQRSLEQIKGGAERASRSLELLDVAVRGVQLAGLATAARALVQAGDRLTQGMARLQTATGSIERAGEVYEALYRNALQTGVAVSDSVDAFQRFSIAAREIGATSDQVVRLVGGLQRVAIVSGASTQEISSATLQLAQALASGVLQGDELRSILEAMPLLAEALARELGVGIGALRQLGAEGQLTAERVFPALLRAAERLGATLDQAPLSLGRAFGQLTAATEGFLGQLDQAIGLSNTLARALSGAARTVDGLRRGAGLLTAGEAQADQRQQAALLARQIATLEAGTDTTRNNGTLRPRLTDADRQRRLQELREQHAELQAAIAGQAQAGAERQRLAEEAAAAQAAEARRRRAAQAVLELSQELDDRFRLNSAYADRVRRLRDAEAAGGIDRAERLRLETLALRERDAALQRLERQPAGEAAAARRAVREAEQAINDTLRAREALIERNEDAYESYQRRLARLSELVQRSQQAGRPVPDITVQREAEAALQALETAEQRLDGSQKRLGATTAGTTDAARELGLTFSSAFEEAVVKGERLQTVLQGVLSDLSRLVLRRAATEPLTNALSGMLGGNGGSFDLGKALATGLGLFPADGGLKAANGAAFDGRGVIPFARGGIVDRPTLFPFARGTGLMGEAGPEAILPLRRGRDGRLGVQTSGPAMAVHVTITSPDADGFRRSQGQVSAAIADAVRRGGRLR